MTLGTPLLERLHKRREGIRDLQIVILSALCLYIVWHRQPAATYLPVSTFQAINTANSTHADRLHRADAGSDPAANNASEPQTTANNVNSAVSNTLASWLASINIQQYPAVLVTALYDIGRERFDGRSMEQYKQWFALTLKIASPMVVFAGDTDTVSFIQQHRQTLPTYVMQRPLQQVYYSELSPWVKSVQQSEQWKQCVQHPKRLEWNLPYYITINWAKPCLLNEVVSQVPAGSAASKAYFAWVDAGGGRWTTAAEGNTWPNIQKVQQMDPSADKLLIQASGAQSSTADLRSFLCGPGDGLMGGVMLGTPATWQRLQADFDDVIHNEFLPQSWLGNDQMILKILLDRNASRMGVVPASCPPQGCRSGPGSAYPIFDWLGVSSISGAT